MLVLAFAALVAGCGADDIVTTPLPSTVPERPPSPAQLAAIRSTPDAPIYWLGSRYREHSLGRAKLSAEDPPDAIFQYGDPRCETGVGCTYPVGVATVRERAPASEEACWRELGAALVLACRGAEAVQIYTGRLEVFVRAADGDPWRAVRALRLKTATGDGSPAALAAPRPFSCDQLERFPDAFAAALPAVLRPTCG